MRTPIKYLLEQNICELPGEQQRKVRKFIERHSKLTTIKYVSKENLNLLLIYRQHFLDEIEERYAKGDMQFLTPRVYGYIRNYIKNTAAVFLKQYISVKKRMLL